MANLSSVFVPRTVAPKMTEKWWKVGQNPCIARYNGTVLPNCFTGSTHIITNKGVVSLKQAYLWTKYNQSFDVPTIDGDWHPATAKYFGVQRLYRVKLEDSTYYCTSNHRWYVQSGNKNIMKYTNQLKPGMRIPYRMCNTSSYSTVKSVHRTDTFEGVYCIVEPITHSFTLNGGEITGNCVGYAYGRFSEILGYFHPELPKCNGGDWLDSVKSTSLKWGTEPKLGAVAVWKISGKAGHVAIVEYINDDGSIMLSESGYNASWNTRFWNSGPRKGPNWYGNPHQFQGFIYNPGTEFVTKVYPYTGGVKYGTQISGTSESYTDVLSSLDMNSAINLSTPLEYSTAVEHPARRFVKSILSHVGRQGYDWVKELTSTTVDNWDVAICCAAAIDCGFDPVIIPRDLFAVDSFCNKLVDNYHGKYFISQSKVQDEQPQVGDIFGIAIDTSNKYSASHVGIVVDYHGSLVFTVERSNDEIILNRRRLKDISWFIRPDWTQVGGTIQCRSLMNAPLYSEYSTHADATLREVGYLSSDQQPSISSSDVKLSVINYTSVLNSLYDAAGFSDIPLSSINYNDQMSYEVDSTGLTPPAAKIIFEFLVDQGLSAAQSVGFLANIKQESGFSTSAVNKSSGASGICQWLGSRKTKMIEFCGSDWKNNLTGQLNYLWTELNSSESKTLTTLKSDVVGNDESAALQATDIVLKQFERPGNYDKESEIRRKNASELWSMISVTSNMTGTAPILGTSNIIKTSLGVSLTSGETIAVPATVNQTGIIANYTSYTKFFPKWSKSTVQRQLADVWDKTGRQSTYYVATIDGYFLVAVSPIFGKVGDIISVVLEDGTFFNCIIGDAKGADATNPYGHVLGKGVDIIEWEANGESQSALRTGLAQAGWLNKKVVKIINYGQWLNR